MSRMVKEFIEIKDYASLDALIERLTEIRDGLPEDGRARSEDARRRRVRPPDLHLLSSARRPRRKRSATRATPRPIASRSEQELNRLQDELGFARSPQRRAGKLPRSSPDQPSLLRAEAITIRRSFRPRGARSGCASDGGPCRPRAPPPRRSSTPRPGPARDRQIAVDRGQHLLVGDEVEQIVPPTL